MERRSIIIATSSSMLLAAVGLVAFSPHVHAGKEDLDTGEQCWRADCFETDQDIPSGTGGNSDDVPGDGSDGASSAGGIRGLVPATGSTSGAAGRQTLDMVTSGHVGTETVVVEIGTGVSLPNDPKFYGITSIDIREHNDRPCHVRIFGNLLDTTIDPNGRLLGEVQLARCEDIVPYVSNKWASLSERENRFVRSVRVCTSGNKLAPLFGSIRLKGLRVLPAEIIPIAKVAERKVKAEFERANCSFWDEAEICDTGSIVTALTMHVIDDSFTGIDPSCKIVESVSVPSGGFKRDQTGY